MYTLPNQDSVSRNLQGFTANPRQEPDAAKTAANCRLKAFHPRNQHTFTGSNVVESFRKECERFSQRLQRMNESLSGFCYTGGAKEELSPVLHTLTERIAALEHMLLKHADGSTTTYGNRTIRLMKTLHEILDRELGNAALTVQDLALELCMSQSTLSRLFRDVYDCKPNDLIRNYRLMRASLLLWNHESSVKEIAYRCGFNNLSYFSKCFKARYGVLPSHVTQKRFTGWQADKPIFSNTLTGT